MNTIFRSILTHAGAGVLLAAAGTATAALTAYEPFNYSTGTLANNTPSTAAGFTGNWTVNGSASIVAGLGYTLNGTLPAANNSLSSGSGSGRQSVSLSAPLASSGTKWLSFLFNQGGNNGGNACGVYFPNGGTGLYLGYGSSAYSATQGYLCIGTMNTTGNAIQGVTSKVNSYLATYGAAMLVVMRIDYGSPNDTVSVYINPSVNSASPPATSTMATSTFSVGTITGIGVQNPGGGYAVLLDEMRIGDTFADVVGYNPTVPAAPTGLTAAGGANSVSLNWNAAVGAASYNVKRSTASGAETTLANVAATSYSDTSVVNGTTYFYKVSSTNAAGESADSPEVSATPNGSIPPSGPAIYEPFNYPAGTLANGTAVTGAGFTGTWTCGAAGTIGAGLAYTGLPVANSALSSGNGRQFASFSNPLSSGTKWISFLFQASGNMGGNIDGVFFPNGNSTCLWFGFGLSPYSSTQGQLGLGSMTTAGTATQGATALQQLGLATYGAACLIVLKIDFNTSGANDTVTVYTNPVANAAAPGAAPAGTYSSYDVGTISGIGLNVQGAATITVDEIRVGDSYGDVVGFVSIPPAAPTGLTAAAGTNSVTLTWTAATGSPNSYNIKRSTTSGSGYTTVGITTVPTVTFTDAVLGGQTYYYVVTAVNGGGEGSPSAEVTASPALGAPVAPTGLMGTAGNAQVALSWTGSPFATSYSVKRATASAGPYTLIGVTTPPTVTYTDSNGLNNGTPYYYVVSATGAGGTSSDTSPISVTPNGPLPLVAAIAQGTGIRWFASNGVTYQVQWASASLGTNTAWNNLGGTIAGNGATNTVFDPAGPPHNFYQVLGTQ